MQAVKFLLVAAAAVCVAQAAEIPRSADKLDLRLFVDSGAAIAKTLFKAINTGLDQSKPDADKILNELAPELKALLRKLIDDNRAKINEEDKRIAEIFATLSKALDSLKPIKTCSEKVSPAGKKLALATEKELAKTVEDVQKKYKKDIDNLKLGKDKTLQKARKLFDTEVDAIVKCLTPGRKDASDCLKKEVDKTVKGAKDIAVDVAILINTANDTLSPILTEVVDKLLPLLQKTVKEGQVILKTLADCVAALK